MGHPVRFLELLDQTPLLVGIRGRAGDRLVNSLRPLPFDRGDTLATPEDERGDLLLLIAGNVREELEVDGQFVPIATIGPVAPVGGLCAFDEGSPRRVRVVAEDRGLAVIVPSETFAQARSTGHGLAQNIEEIALDGAMDRAKASSLSLAQAAHEARWPLRRVKVPRSAVIALPTDESGLRPVVEPQRDERPAVLRTVPGLWGIPEALLSTLSEAFVAVDLDEETLFRAGEPARALFVLGRGSVELLTRAPSGREVPAVLCRPGAVLGVRGCFTWGNHELSAVARGPARLLALPLWRLRSLLSDSAHAVALRRMVIPALARATARMDLRAAILTRTASNASRSAAPERAGA